MAKATTNGGEHPRKLPNPDVLTYASNDGETQILSGLPYIVEVGITGTARFLFHRWNVDAIEEKSKAAKGSKAKKTDDVESFVYRLPHGELAIPGEYLRMSIVNAAKFEQDPRSPRKSAMDLFKAAVIVLDELCPLGTKDWDMIDRRRVMVQRAGVTRHRPAFDVGWSIKCQLQIMLPEYISEAFLLKTLTRAGQLVGVGDFRPTFGRYGVSQFKRIDLS